MWAKVAHQLGALGNHVLSMTSPGLWQLGCKDAALWWKGMSPGNTPRSLRIWTLLGMTQAKGNTELVALACWDANTSLLTLNVVQKESFLLSVRQNFHCCSFLFFFFPLASGSASSVRLAYSKKNAFRDQLYTAVVTARGRGWRVTAVLGCGMHWLVLMSRNDNPLFLGVWTRQEFQCVGKWFQRQIAFFLYNYTYIILSPEGAVLLSLKNHIACVFRGVPSVQQFFFLLSLCSALATWQMRLFIFSFVVER